MIPLRDDNPTLRTTAVTFILIGLNVIAWIVIQGLGTEPALSRSLCQLGVIPGVLLGTVPPGAHIELGPDTYCVLSESPNWITPVTSMFLHGGWFHIIGNMWFLYVFGDNVEDSMGPVRFFIFYILCGLAAVAVQMMSNPSSAVPMIGASGAIGGVMGAYAVLYPRAPVHLLIILGFYISKIVLPALYMLGYWFLFQLLYGVLSTGREGGGVAFWAHIGGFVAGIVLAQVFKNPARVAEHRLRFVKK